MIIQQSSGVLSGCVPGSATTTGSVTPHSTRSARSGSGSTILFQGLIDLSSSGPLDEPLPRICHPPARTSWRPRSGSQGSQPGGQGATTRTAPCRSGTKKMPKTHITASKGSAARFRRVPPPAMQNRPYHSRRRGRSYLERAANVRPCACRIDPRTKCRVIVMIGCSVVGFFQLDLRRNWISHMSSGAESVISSREKGGLLNLNRSDC
jgi:hypothetical protein